MANDGGVWVKLEDAGSSATGPAVINDAASNYDNKDAGVTIDGKTYDIYTFTTATTTRSMRLTDEAQARITDEDLLMAIATTELPADFTGDPVELFDRKYRNQLRNAFEIAPAADPGLSLTVDTPGLVDALIVAGGGGGGGGQNAAKGGGGAGGLINTSLLVDAHTYKVKVGNGGRGGGDSYSPSGGTNGGDSLAFGLTAYGGGGGGYSPSYNTGVTTAGRDGGSGGGGNPPGGTLSYHSYQGHAGDATGGGGAGGQNGNKGGPGIILDFDLQGDVEYAIGGNANASDAPTTPGSGGKAGAAYAAGSAGKNGIVIVRVEI